MRIRKILALCGVVATALTTSLVAVDANAEQSEREPKSAISGPFRDIATDFPRVAQAREAIADRAAEHDLGGTSNQVVAEVGEGRERPRGGFVRTVLPTRVESPSLSDPWMTMAYPSGEFRACLGPLWSVQLLCRTRDVCQ